MPDHRSLWFNNLTMSKSPKNEMNEKGQKYWWIYGNSKTGFKIHDRPVGGRYTPEPIFGTWEDTQRHIALQYLLNA